MDGFRNLGRALLDLTKALAAVVLVVVFLVVFFACPWFVWIPVLLATGALLNLLEG